MTQKNLEQEARGLLEAIISVNLDELQQALEVSLAGFATHGGKVTLSDHAKRLFDGGTNAELKAKRARLEEGVEVIKIARRITAAVMYPDGSPGNGEDRDV